MSKPIQIIINDIVLPFMGGDRYSCPEVELKEQIPMISGRLVEEVRGMVYQPSYSCDYIGNELCRQVLEVLRSKGAKTCAVLPDGGTELVTSKFLVESITPPTVSFSINGEVYWHNLSFTLREVKPHA